MKQLPVIIPPRVRDQIFEQMLFISRHSIEYALAWENRLAKAIENYLISMSTPLIRRRAGVWAKSFAELPSRELI